MPKLHSRRTWLASPSSDGYGLLASAWLTSARQCRSKRDEATENTPPPDAPAGTGARLACPALALRRARFTMAPVLDDDGTVLGSARWLRFVTRTWSRTAR